MILDDKKTLYNEVVRGDILELPHEHYISIEINAIQLWNTVRSCIARLKGITQ